MVSYGWKSKDNKGGSLWQRTENSSALLSSGGNISSGLFVLRAISVQVYKDAI